MEKIPSVSPSKKEAPDAKNFPRVPVADLVPYARNSRTHSPEQVARVAASIREFGFLNPVIVDSTGMIIAGHCRVMAAQKLGLESVPCVDASHLTEAQKRAYVLADNRLALDAGWDDEMLRIELQDLAADGFDKESPDKSKKKTPTNQCRGFRRGDDDEVMRHHFFTAPLSPRQCRFLRLIGRLQFGRLCGLRFRAAARSFGGP